MSDKKLKTTAIKGKPYVQVNERLKYFRENFKGYSLESELIAVSPETALIRAVVRNDKGVIVATGTAFERKDSKANIVNQTSHIENCETSAWGRALGNFGIGIDDSVASADEVQNAIINQETGEVIDKKPSAATASSTVASPKKETPEQKPPFGASAEQVRKIASLAKDVGMDVKKDIYEKMQIAGSPTPEQAVVIIERLEQKLADKRKEIAATESK